MPASEVADFRFATTEPDWFADMHQRIILPNAQSERPEHLFPVSAIVEDYAITQKDDHGIEDRCPKMSFLATRGGKSNAGTTELLILAMVRMSHSAASVSSPMLSGWAIASPLKTS